MVVTKDATIAVASVNVTLITIGYFFVCLFVLICFCSGFAAETRYKGNTRRQRRNKFVLDEQQRTLKDLCPLTSSAWNQSAKANGESRNNSIYSRMYSRTANI